MTFPNVCPDCQQEFDPGHACPPKKERWVTHNVTDPDWHPGHGHWHPHREVEARLLNCHCPEMFVKGAGYNKLCPVHGAGQAQDG